MAENKADSFLPIAIASSLVLLAAGCTNSEDSIPDPRPPIQVFSEAADSFTTCIRNANATKGWPVVKGRFDMNAYEFKSLISDPPMLPHMPIYYLVAKGKSSVVFVVQAGSASGSIDAVYGPFPAKTGCKTAAQPSP